MLKRAMEITKEALGSMTGPDGKPYLDHALRVMEQMETEDEKMVALLHDVVEDGDISLRELKDAGLPYRVVQAVGQLTKRPDITYFDYIEDISCNPLAARVKAAEIRDNLDAVRVNKMSFCTFSLEERAQKALKLLEHC